MLAVPLAIPAYIGGIIHLTLMRPHGGVIPKLLQNTTGLAMPEVNLLGFWGAAFVLTIFSYPYIYLLSGAAFRWLNASIEEASRTLGLSPRKTFWGVVLPTLRPGLTAGMILVALDVMAEYGTVALLRYETFTSAIFFQLTGRYDRSMAAMLSGVLVTLAILFLWVEVRTQEQRRFTQLESHWRPARLIHLGRWRYPALLITLGIVSISLLIPLTILIVWSIHALLAPDALATLGRAGTQGYGSYVWNSLWTSGAAAALAVMISLPVAIFALRQPDRMGRFISRFCQIGYAIPGVVIAFSLLFVVNRALPVLYATPMVVVMAYVLRHLPQAVRGSESALIQVSTSLEDAARTLGRTSTGAFFQVTLPLILPGLLAGGALVFLTSLKELPATLLLRPAGFDSLAVRIWIWAVDGFYLQAAPAALLLVLVSAIPLSFLLRKEAMVR
jgi:iron(III) transport system permease protein